MKYRKKPVVIEAVEFQGTPASAIEVFETFDIPGARVRPDLQNLERCAISIPTLEGVMRADAGDWIIRGVKGEFYPCRPDIFAETHEPVPEES